MLSPEDLIIILKRIKKERTVSNVQGFSPDQLNEGIKRLIEIRYIKEGKNKNNEIKKYNITWKAGVFLEHYERTKKELR